MIVRIIAVMLTSAALTLNAEEVAYSDLELKLPPGSVTPVTSPPPQPVQLANHETPLAYPPNEPIPAPGAEPQRLGEARESPMFVSANGCADCIGPCVEFNRWYGGADLLIFQMSYANSRFTITDDRIAGTIRPYLGWEHEDGLGVRVSGFVMNHTADVAYYETETEPELRDQSSFAFSTVNLDLYQRLRFNSTDLILGCGSQASYLQIDQWGASDLVMSQEAGGVSGFVEFRRTLMEDFDSRWSFIGKGRVGLLVGEGRTKQGGQYLGGSDANLTVAELGFGIEYNRRFAHHNFVMQYMAESQRWDSSKYGEFGFDGASLRLGFQW